METSFGSWIKRRRKALDLTQGELAARVGCSRSAIFKIEANERRPSRQIAELLARHLEMPDEQRAQFLMVARGSKSPEALAPLPAPVVFDLQTTSQVPLSNLPQPPFPLVGRVHELGEIKRLLNSPECRLLTLAGPGGVDKTRLALQAALDLANETSHPFSDGLYFVALESLNAVEFIVPAIAEAIGFSFFSPGPQKIYSDSFRCLCRRLSESCRCRSQYSN